MATKIYSPDLAKNLSNIEVFISNISIRSKTSTKKIAQQILEDSDSIPPMVPVDTGDLKSTGRVEPTDSGHAVVYGGDAASGANVFYAELVHDDLRPRKYQRPGSGPKFLEAHFYRRMPTMHLTIDEDMREAVLEAFGGGK